MAIQPEKMMYPEYQQPDPRLYPPVASAPPPPYTPEGPYWDPCGAYSAILEDSWKFFQSQMSQQWSLLKHDKFLTVETLKADKYRVRGLRMSGEFASKNKPGFDKGSTMENMKARLSGIDSIKELPDVDIKSVRLIEQPGLNTSVYVYTEKYSWPMTNREYLTVEQMKKDPSTGNIMIIGVPVTLPGVPAKSKPIRALQEYLYILEYSKLNPNNVFGTFYHYFDIRGDITPTDQEDCGFKDLVKLFLELPKYI